MYSKYKYNGVINRSSMKKSINNHGEISALAKKMKAANKINEMASIIENMM